MKWGWAPEDGLQSPGLGVPEKNGPQAVRTLCAVPERGSQAAPPHTHTQGRGRPSRGLFQPPPRRVTSHLPTHAFQTGYLANVGGREFSAREEAWLSSSQLV